MTLHSTRVAPMNFIFDEIANYKIFSDYLVGYEGFAGIAIQSVWNFCQKNHCEYVLFNKYGDMWDYFPDYGDTNRLMEHFEIIAANSDLVILKFKDKTLERTGVSSGTEDDLLLKHYVSYMKDCAEEDKKHGYPR